MRKLSGTCGDQTRLTLELRYPGICDDIDTVLSNNWCDALFSVDSENIWPANKTNQFKSTILTYCQENIMKINIFIKDPFAVELKIVEHASL